MKTQVANVPGIHCYEYYEKAVSNAFNARIYHGSFVNYKTNGRAWSKGTFKHGRIIGFWLKY